MMIGFVPLVVRPEEGAASLSDRRARLMLLQDAGDLFVGERLLHSLVLTMGQSLLQFGLAQRGKVTSVGCALSDAWRPAEPWATDRHPSPVFDDAKGDPEMRAVHHPRICCKPDAQEACFC